MEKVRYMISDAARILALEQHVLRYWEDELQLDIPRNEMGHRYYTDENIKELMRIKELRSQGYQLKAIRMYLKKERQIAKKEKENSAFPEDMDGFVTLTNAKELGLCPEPSGELEDVSQDGTRIKLEQFKILMSEIIAEAMRDNNELLTTHVEERILKEMNYLMQEHYQMEEDYYKKLDEAIRGSIRKKKQEKKKFFAKKRTP
ncbi:MAG: helix-turn-helix domain-containing protein [Lachnospiraceae bacterium]|nr:helix-turn-helix domain-containing protein [Lachnospiraceae bacterium]MDD6191601.1 helix-turn-helix domain-containing protein [Lachnospiraceae bacterium]MDY4794057.1 helix-turn-helix domain-containing protein [Pararoseburia sp.]